MYRRYRPSYMTSAIRYCASIKLASGRSIQVNFESPKALVRALRDYIGKNDSLLKIYQKGN